MYTYNYWKCALSWEFKPDKNAPKEFRRYLLVICMIWDLNILSILIKIFHQNQILFYKNFSPHKLKAHSSLFMGTRWFLFVRLCDRVCNFVSLWPVHRFQRHYQYTDVRYSESSPVDQYQSHQQYINIRIITVHTCRWQIHHQCIDVRAITSFPNQSHH